MVDDKMNEEKIAEFFKEARKDVLPSRERFDIAFQMLTQEPVPVYPETAGSSLGKFAQVLTGMPKKLLTLRVVEFGNDVGFVMEQVLWAPEAILSSTPGMLGSLYSKVRRKYAKVF